MAEPNPDCPICGGSGWVFADPERIVPTSGRRCSCLQGAINAERLSMRLDRANLPPDFAVAEIDEFVIRPEALEKEGGEPIDAKNLEIIRELAATPLPGGVTVFLTGPSGTGKTYLGSALLRAQIIAHGATGLYVQAVDYLRSLQPDMRTPGEQRALRDLARNVDVLLIDDLGTEKGSEFSRREMFDLFDSRLNHRRANIITSNYSLNALFSGDDAVNAERIKSRLRQQLTGVAWPKGMLDYRPEVGRRRAAEARDRAESAYREERYAREEAFATMAGDEFDFSATQPAAKTARKGGGR